MTPPSQGGRGSRIKLALVVFLCLATVVQGRLPGQTDDADKDQVQYLNYQAEASDPTDDDRPPARCHQQQPVPNQQQRACSIAAPPLRGQPFRMQELSLPGSVAPQGVDPQMEQIQRKAGPRVLHPIEATRHCPGQRMKESRDHFPCPAGTLCGASKPVSHVGKVPGTSLTSGCTGAAPPLPSRISMTTRNGHFGSSLELEKGSLIVSDTRGQEPPVSDTRFRQESAGALTERVKRQVSDTLPLARGAPVSDTRTMATASDDDITIYIASAGVQNAEQIAGMNEPWTLPGSNNSHYYDEPQYGERCETVRAIAQGDRAELIDCRGLRDPHVDNSLHRHLGTHFVNAAANVNQRGFAQVLEDLCQAMSALFAWAMTQSQTGIHLVLCFLCNSGRHRSVLMVGLLEHFFATRGLHARARHLCSSAWGHMCDRHPPCQACDADWRTARWVNTYQYFEDQFLRLCYKHKFHHSEWWAYFRLPNLPPGGPPGHAMLPPVVPQMEEDARPPRARPATPPLPKDRGVNLMEAATRARSQGATRTARVLETRQQTQTAEHRAQSRVRFDEAMADIGIQNVHHAQVDAPTAPRGHGTTAKAKAANYAASHRATVAAAAQRTAEADPAQGGQTSTARGSTDPAPAAAPQRGRRRRASRPPEETAATSAAAAADSSPGAPLNTNTPWDLGADISREDLEWVAEHMPDMAPRFDDYEFWSIHEAITDEAQSRGDELRDQGVYEDEDVDSAFPREERVTKAKEKAKAKARAATKGRAKAEAPRAEEAGPGPRDLPSHMRTQRRRTRRKTRVRSLPQGIEGYSVRLPGQAGGVQRGSPEAGQELWAEGGRGPCKRQEGPRPGRTLPTSHVSTVKTKHGDDTETSEKPDTGSTEDRQGCTSPGLTCRMTPLRCKPQGLVLVAKG